MLDDKLKELLEFVKTTDLQELSWQKGATKIAFSRSEAVALAQAKPVAGQPEDEEEAAPEPLYIRSTMVGTFYRSETASRPPMVVEGTAVANGQPVGSIEAMKIRKDVVSNLDCRILRAMVTDGHAVEYGQPLFEVELEEANV
jgi:acetyl-CoA carboxylase biotin carboxyl carrier protein